MTGPNPSTAFEPRANSLQADEAHSETQIQTCSDLREGPLADYYIWRHPDRGLTICLNPETIDRLQCESLANVDRLEPGCEISGILLGRRQAHGQDKTVIVTGYRGVASIEQPGSQSAPYKTAAFEAVLRAINSSDRSGASSIVGFYRSHNRNGLYLSDDDLTLIQTYFSDPDTIVLIIKTLTIGACTAGFFFRDERGLLQSEFPQVELPLSPVEGVTHRRAKSSPAATPVVPIRAYLHAEPDMQPVAALTAAGRPSSTGRNRLQPWAMYIGSALFAGALGVWYGLTLRSPLHKDAPAQATAAPVHAMLNLDVRQTAAGHVELSWDRQRPEITAAHGGSLLIRDGDERERVELKAEHLRSGAIAYSPTTADVDFRLELQRNGSPPLFDSVHVVMPEQGSGGGTKGRPR